MRALRAMGAVLFGLAMVAALVVVGSASTRAHAGDPETVSDAGTTPSQQVTASELAVARLASGGVTVPPLTDADPAADSAAVTTAGITRGSGPAAGGSDAAGPNTVGPNTVGPNTVGSNTVGSNTVGSNTVGSNTVGSNTSGTSTSSVDAAGNGTGSGAGTSGITASSRTRTANPVAHESGPAAASTGGPATAPGTRGPSRSEASTSDGPSSFPDTITPSAAPPARITMALNHVVESAAEQGIDEHVVVLDRHNGATIYSTGADEKVPAESIAKILFAVDALDSPGGEDDVDPHTLAELHQMIAQSNDSLADDFYHADGEGAIVTRMAHLYGLTGTEPAANPRYWGGIEITARDIASLLSQALTDPKTGPFLTSAMTDATHTAWDGYNQEFGLNAVIGAGSKQGWGCCLGGVVAIHSVGFTRDRIVVALSTAQPNANGINVPQVSAFQDDPGFVASVKAITRVVQAAVAPA